MLQQMSRSTQIIGGSNTQTNATQSNNRYKGIIKFGESQLNSKLDKAKSKPDLFEEFRNRIGQGESVQDIILSK